MTLIIRLCAVCAVCSLLELASTGSKLKDGMRLIGGMIMLSITVSRVQSIVVSMAQQTELMGVFECLMR